MDMVTGCLTGCLTGFLTTYFALREKCRACLRGAPAAAAAAAGSPGGATLGALPEDEGERLQLLQKAVEAWHPQRWVLRREVGRGGSGFVYQCTDARLGLIAIKFSHGREPRKLEREAALMQRVAHEGVCKLFEYQVRTGPRLVHHRDYRRRRRITVE
jgi:hypothetical protein